MKKIMDHNRDYSFQNDSKLSQVHFLKKTVQILVSISIFSLFVSQPSLLNAVLNYLDQYTSTFSIKFFHYNSERNYIFLLFNGILAVILKNSGLISKSPMNSNHEDSRKEKNHHFPEVSEAEFSRRKAEVTGKAVKEAEEHGRQNGILVTVKETGEEISERATGFTERAEVEEDEKQSSIPVKDGKNELQTEEVLGDEDQQEEEEEEEEQEHGLMSTDELNRKCDEFIKKMREGIKVEFRTINHGLKSHA